MRPPFPSLLAALLAAPLVLTACGDKGDDTASGPGAGPSDDTGDDDTGGDVGGDDSAQPVDADGDGYGSAADGGDDCDDADPTVHPDADEACDGVDNDCDGDVDEGTTTTFYADADGDGFGDGDAPVEACALADGIVADASDCDDADPTTNPGAAELGCDGVDNDCDGSVDPDDARVPTTHATLQAAVDALPDGAEICVEPGTYAEALDLSGRTLRFSGQRGPAVTILDVGTTAPMIRVVGESETFEAGDVTLSGFTITGGEIAADGVAVQGGFAQVVDGTLRLEDVTVTGLSGSMSNGGSLDGLLVHSDGGSLTLHDVTVDGAQITLGPDAATGTSASPAFAGGLVRTIGGELDIDTLVVTDLLITADPTRATCGYVGAALLAGDGQLRSSSGTGTGGTRFTIADLAVSDSTVSLDCADTARAGPWVRLADEPGELVGLQLTGNVVQIEANSASGFFDGLFGWFVDGGATFSVVDISDNTTQVTADASSFAYGGTYLEGVTLSHATLWSNSTTVTGGSSSRVSQWLDLENTAADHLDVRDNALQAGDAAGPLVYVYTYDDDFGPGELVNVVLAGNRMEAAGVGGAWIEIDASDASARLRNADIVGNTMTGDLPSWSGVIAGCADDADAVLELSNLQVVDNTLVGAGELVALNDWGCDGGTVFAYSNLTGQDADTNLGAVVGSDGHISVDPAYTDVSGADPTTWDLRLQASSPAVDAGDPGVLDDDGSTSDLGAYGGPGGASW
jgi:hypothetical protein